MGFILPIALCTFFCFATYIVFPPGTFGVGSPRPVKTLGQAFDVARDSGRDKIVLINSSGHTDGDIEQVLDRIASFVTAQNRGIRVIQAGHESAIAIECPSNPRGATGCFGAIEMQSSPNEGTGGIWNYTIHTDAVLANSPLTFNIDSTTNPEEVYLLPIQRVINTIIVELNSTDVYPLARSMELPFTSKSEDERQAQDRRFHHRAIIHSLGVTFLSAVLWIAYHLTGFIASERESGMSLLLDSMMAVSQPWVAQAARIMAHHLSFSIIYAPAWIVNSFIMHFVVYYNTNFFIVLTFHGLAGLAFASMSVLVASFFKTAQLSGATATLAILILGILAQTIKNPGNSTVACLSIVFAPCSYVYFSILMARFELNNQPASLTSIPPDSPWSLPGITFWVFLIVQIFVYPFIGAVIEGNTCQGSMERLGSRGERIDSDNLSDDAVHLHEITKIYKPSNLMSLLWKPKGAITAVNKLTFKAGRGQIVALLGANGSGKSTTLNAIAGWIKLTSGSIMVDRTGGFGIAPQKNVLWNDLTVEEHIRFFHRLKSPETPATEVEIVELIRSIDLYHKRGCLSKILSGGQKRRLQLGIMLTGGSAICCVDEVSSGVDPVSRRKLWDILLAERSKRTIILTTHFLDEADLLADHIAILSKGMIRAQGSSLELKERFGTGYTIHVDIHKSSDTKQLPLVSGVIKTTATNSITYNAPSAGLAARTIRALEGMKVTNYRLTGPTIEDVFLRLTQETQDEQPCGGADYDNASMEYNRPRSRDDPQLNLLDGEEVGFARQTSILLVKRMIVFKRNWLPYLLAILLPIFAAGLTSLYVKGESPIGCLPPELNSTLLEKSAFEQVDQNSLMFLAGPPSMFSASSLQNLQLLFSDSLNDAALGAAAMRNVTMVDTYDAFLHVIQDSYRNITTGLWLGDEDSQPTIGWVANLFITSALIAQQLLDVMLTNTTISASWSPIGIPFQPGVGGTLSLVIYMGIALVCYPAFFALYPSYERVKSVRELQYSNGVRPVSLWAAYLLFDFTLGLVGVGIATALWAGLSRAWFHLGYAFIVLVLYGLASILFSYMVSLFTKTQLATFAWAAGLQAVIFLLYLMTYMCIITYGQVIKIDSSLLILHFTLSAFAPIGSATRALFLATNLYATACTGNELATNPGGITKYGGPILYLIIQCLVLFYFLIWMDNRSLRWPSSSFFTEDNDAKRAAEIDEFTGQVDDVSMRKMENGLHVMQLTKTFSKSTAVDNVTFSVKRGEVFALLGPNGAGKSTIMSLIRGDIKPSRNGGTVLIDNTSVSANATAARARLGVCPQVDALDRMTVREHLEFYARIRGITDVEHNVQSVLHATSLDTASTCMAQSLSGGNKRKLSLGIALICNPTVLLLDEPSSSLDAAAKRIMWKTLLAAVPGRSILLTTHSMEEADAVADRVGILARRMLAQGTAEELCHQFGDTLYVHLVSNTAPRTSGEETQLLISRLYDIFPMANVEEKTYQGQIRFCIRKTNVPSTPQSQSMRPGDADCDLHSAIGRLVVILEENKAQLGIRHFSVSPATLEQAFLMIVSEHEDVAEIDVNINRRVWSSVVSWVARLAGAKEYVQPAALKNLSKPRGFSN